MKELKDYLYYHEPGPPDIKIYCGLISLIDYYLNKCYHVVYEKLQNNIGKRSAGYASSLCYGMSFRP